MVYDSTKGLLRSMVLALETGPETGWDDHIESARECLYEMHQMTRAFCRVEKPKGPHAAVQIPVERLHRAMPHVKEMVVAIRRKDQVAALESGRAALAAM